MKENFCKKIIRGIFLGLISAILVLFLSEIFAKHFFFRMESQTYDWRMRRAVEHPENPIDEIVIVDIDERSIQKLGSYYHWPREYWQKLIDFLTSAKEISWGVVTIKALASGIVCATVSGSSPVPGGESMIR